MTKDCRKLLLADLCARLPYGFTIHRYSDNCDIVIEGNDIYKFAHFLEYSEGEDFKPYLRPMSSMTERERHIFDTITRGYTVHQQVSLFDWLNSHHFDYRGLIERGLALEAPEDMYT